MGIVRGKISAESGRFAFLLRHCASKPVRPMEIPNRLYPLFDRAIHVSGESASDDHTPVPKHQTTNETFL